MDNQKVIQITQQWAKANGLDSVNTEKVLGNMAASDFVVFSNALEDKDYNTVSQLYHQAEASIQESFSIFSENKLMESEFPLSAKINLVKSFPLHVLFEAFQKVPGAPTSYENMSIAALQTQYVKYMYEYAAPGMNAQSSAKPFGSSNIPSIEQDVSTVNFGQDTRELSPTPQQLQVSADQQHNLEKQAPEEAEVAHISKPERVNDVVKPEQGLPAGITDPKAEKLAKTVSQLNPEGQEMADNMDDASVQRLAKLAGIL